MRAEVNNTDIGLQLYISWINQCEFLLPTVSGLVPLADMFNTAVDVGGENVKCGYNYYYDDYGFVCWATRDILSGEEVGIQLL